MARFAWENETGFYYHILGLIEAPEGRLPEDTVVPVRAIDHPSGTGFALNEDGAHFSGYELPPPCRMKEIVDILSEDLWLYPPDRDGGGVFFRASRLPARPGNVTMLMGGTIRANSTYIDQARLHEAAMVIFALEPYVAAPSNGFILTGAWQPAVLADPHAAIDEESPFGLPIWGWGRDPVAVTSTLPVETIDEVDGTRSLLRVHMEKLTRDRVSAERLEAGLARPSARLIPPLERPAAAQCPKKPATKVRDIMRQTVDLLGTFGVEPRLARVLTAKEIRDEQRTLARIMELAVEEVAGTPPGAVTAPGSRPT